MKRWMWPVLAGMVLVGNGCRFDPDAVVAADARPDVVTGCGNGQIDNGELCDGQDLGQKTCLDFGYSGGVLGCTASCTYDETQCIPLDCGNGQIDNNEECDGGNLGGATCQSLGMTGGTLSCTATCVFDTSQCYGCGNGIKEAGETCDGSDFGGATCSSEGKGTEGSLSCSDDCKALLKGTCHTCGDGTVEGPMEECDGLALAGVKCTDRNHAGGEMGCTNSCTFDESGCFDCDDGVCDKDKGETIEVCPEDCGWVTVSAGFDHTCGVMGNGTAWCWGANDKGQLGDGTTNDSPTPVQVRDWTNVVGISAGHSFTCAVRDNGTVWCWGHDDHGQLGDGSITDRSTPVAVLGGWTNVASVTAGGDFACALRDNGEVWCWGNDDHGQLGNGNGTIGAGPVQVSLSSDDATALDAGNKHACAVRSSGSTVCWGQNDKGQLGKGANGDEVVPVSVAGGHTFVTISAGEKHTCAVDASNALYCWGENVDGQLGMVTGPDQMAIPTAVTNTNMTGGVAVAAGGHHSCGLDASQPDAFVWCWGKNDRGQLGDGSTNDHNTAVGVKTTTSSLSALEVSAGDKHSCAVGVNHQAYCWGANDKGQLGDESTADRSFATRVTLP